MDSVVYIALGSNMGDRELHLYSAVKEISSHEEVMLETFSSIYETDPVGFEDQDKFLNMVVKVKTKLGPSELLRFLQEVELMYGRERKIKWGPRTLDLDILLYNQENIETERLIIPHPRMTQRAFVLLPLIEIDKNIQIPSIETPVNTLINELQDREGVRVWKRKSGEDVFELFES